MALPFPEFASPPAARGMTRSRFRFAVACHGANILCGHFSYLEVGCPRQAPVFDGALSEAQLTAAGNIRDDLLSYLRSDRGLASPTFVGGRARLAQQLLVLTEAAPGQMLDLSVATAALPVDPSRVSLPERAGSIDPAKVLPAPYRDAFLNWEREVRVHSSDWPSPLPRSCHTLPKDRERDFIVDLVRRGMGSLILASQVPTDPATGQPILSGFFCVVHKPDKDRLINDRRAVNETELRLKWLSLPAGPQFCLLFLGRGETVRASADDFETYFYSVRAPAETTPWNATGRLWRAGAFPPDVRGSLGVEDSVYFTMEVQGMGGRNSMDVCQLVHESMLREADCLRESERLDFSLPPPSGATWEGAYADDHVVVQL